jgi:hypothetical protein
MNIVLPTVKSSIEDGEESIIKQVRGSSEGLEYDVETLPNSNERIMRKSMHLNNSTIHDHLKLVNQNDMIRIKSFSKNQGTGVFKPTPLS